MEAFDGPFLDRAVHSFDLTVGPGMVGPGQPVLNAVGLADHVEAHRPGVGGVAVPWLLCELDSVVLENGVNLAGRGFEHVLKEFPGCVSVGVVYELVTANLLVRSIPTSKYSLP